MIRKDTINGTNYTLTKYAGKIYATWTQDGKTQRKSTGTTDPDAAYAFLLGFAEERVRPAGVMKLWDMKYADAKGLTKVRADGVRKRMDAAFGHLSPDKLTHTHLDAYVKAGLRERARGTVRYEMSLLFAALRAAEKRGLCACPEYDLPKASAPRTRFLTDAECDALIEAAKPFPREHAFLRIALGTGARKQAILDLTWDRVDFENRIIHLLPEGAEQSRKRRPSIRIGNSLYPFLWELRSRSEGEKVLPDGTVKIDRSLDRIAESAGIKGFHPHVTRHTVATKLVRKGVPIYEVAKFLGCSVRVVETTYGHWSPDAGAAAAAEL